MTIKNGDKSAMPLPPSDETSDGSGCLSKREMMAMHMMNGLLSKPGHSFNEHDVANDAVRAADALLAALERTK